MKRSAHKAVSEPGTKWTDTRSRSDVSTPEGAARTRDARAEAILLEQVLKLYRLPTDVPIEALAEPAKTYVKYALGALNRGQAALDRIRPHRSAYGARCLDVGCAYGGFLAAAAQAGASEVVGFDIDRRLVEIARSYLSALGIDGLVLLGDVLDGTFVRSLGCFDLIMCNDVIEHVTSVSACIANLSAALRPGGILYMAVPNRRSPALIRSDPHFQLFGIVLLARPEAIRCHRLARGTDRYDVGDFFDLEHYTELMGTHGLTYTITNAPPKTAHWCVQKLETEFSSLRRENDEFRDSRLPADLIVSIRQAVSSTIELFDRDFREYRAFIASRQNDLATAKSLEIARRYYLPTWYFVARKP